MSVRYIFPNHPYVGYSLRDPDWIAENLADGWGISQIAIWRDRKAISNMVLIKHHGETWNTFDGVDDQWLILTEDGVPFYFFESQLDMEVAAKELANFKAVRLTATHVDSALADAGKYRFLK